METVNKSNNQISQGESLQVNSFKTVSNRKTPPDFSPLIKKLKQRRKFNKNKAVNNGDYRYHNAIVNTINFVLKELSSLGIVD